MNSIVRVGVGVFVWKDDKFLMGLRRGSHGADTWSLPGGHLEMNESWEEGAAREVMEETGMKITNIHFLTATNDIFQKELKHYITIWIYSDWAANEPTITEPDKFIRLEWRDFKTLPTPLFEPCWRNLKHTKPKLFT